MYDDLEADFWKDIFVHLQHKNMVRSDAGKLTLEDAENAFERFSFAHLEISAEYSLNKDSDGKTSFATWEVSVTAEIKLRLFIQNQIKASLLQRRGSEYVKIADAKFPYNPFSEISEFLSKRDEYERSLYEAREKSLRNDRRTKIALEFIKAAADKKFRNTSVFWNIGNEGCNQGEFILTVGVSPEERKIHLTETDFMQKLDEIVLQ